MSNDPIELHRATKGKIELGVKTPVHNREDLSCIYTPGVGEVSRAVAEDIQRSWDLTSRGNWVAVVSDGTAVLGLGDIGPEAALPVMEGKAVLFKQFAGVDAFPICLNTKNVNDIVAIVKALAPSFGGINLEDISAPRCFEIEQRLIDELDIPVFHDDQHGTAIVVLAGLLNALKITNRAFEDCKVVLSGAGAAGVSIAKMLLDKGVKELLVVDSRGILSSNRTDMNEVKTSLCAITNPNNKAGDLHDAITGADVFIGVSAPGILTAEMVREMATDPIVFALANPIPEIMPEAAKQAGAAVVATGRSDFPNQINNALAFPGIFRGALDVRARRITQEMKSAAVEALASSVKNPDPSNIIPDIFDPSVASGVADAVSLAWKRTNE